MLGDYDITIFLFISAIQTVFPVVMHFQYNRIAISLYFSSFFFINQYIEKAPSD